VPRIEKMPTPKTGEHDLLVKNSNSMDIDVIRRQGICFNYKKKEHITA